MRKDLNAFDSWDDRPPRRCTQCGRQAPSHARDCPTLGMGTPLEPEHHVPDGENDPGWPEGTPEHVKRWHEQDKPRFAGQGLEPSPSALDALTVLLRAVSNGWTLQLGPANPGVFGVIEWDDDHTIEADGAEVGTVLVALASMWLSLHPEIAGQP